MSRQAEYEKHRHYIENEGLDKIIDFRENIDYQQDIFDSVSGELDISFPPQPNDLVRLHKLVRKRRCFTVLEFGIGYSTIVLADALKKNEEEWQNLLKKPKIRNRYMFQLFSVDTSKMWIEKVKKRIPEYLISRTNINYSPVENSYIQWPNMPLLQGDTRYHPRSHLS